MCVFDPVNRLEVAWEIVLKLANKSNIHFSSDADIVSGDYPMQNRPLCFSSIPSVLYLQMEEYISTKWSPDNGRNSTESEQWFPGV